MKKAIVIYDSKFGNTEKIARALRQGMKKQGIKVDCVKVDGVDVNKLVEYDFLAIGGPTHRRSVSESMKFFLGKLSSVDLKGKKVFAFDTKRRHWLAGSAAKSIEKELRRMDLKIIKRYSSAIIFEEEKGERRESETKEEWKERWRRSARLQEGMEEMFEQIGVEIAKSIR